MRPGRTARLAGVGVLLLTVTACAGPAPARTTAATTAAPAPAAAPAAPARTSAVSPRPTPRPTVRRTTATTRPAAKKPARPRTRSAPAPGPASTVVDGLPLKTSGTWRRAFSPSAGAVSCAATLAQLKASGTPRLTVGRTTLVVGFQQFGDNQDPVFLRFDGSRKVYCEHHEHQAPDGRAMGIAWDGGPKAYVVYTVVGGGTELEAKARRGWLSSYGNGGASSKVTVLAEVELRFGTVQRATFLVARVVKNGQPKTNTIVPAAAPLVTSRGVAVLANSAFSPLNPDFTPMCAGGSEYPSKGPGGASYVGVFASDLGSLTCARTWGCGHVRKPCPNLG